MPLVPATLLLRTALGGGYAIGYFESWNMESLQGVLDAMEETRSPAILGFSGDFMSRSGRLTPERVGLHAALAKRAAEEAKVPCAVIFNECPHDEWTRKAIKAGFNFAGVAANNDAPGGYAKRCREMADYAHSMGCAIEAELGELPSGVTGTPDGGDVTDPAEAAQFVEETKVDALAVSVGNVHILTSGRQGLDLKRLEDIGEHVSVPLVLHGGSGISDDDLRQAISLGIAKVNYGTYLKQRYINALRTTLTHVQPNPHEVLAGGGRDDLLVAGRLAVREAVLERIPLLGCAGRG